MATVNRETIAKAGGAAGGLSGVAAVVLLVMQYAGYAPSPAVPACDHGSEAADALEKRFEDHLADERAQREALSAWMANQESIERAQWRKMNEG